MAENQATLNTFIFINISFAIILINNLKFYIRNFVTSVKKTLNAREIIINREKWYILANSKKLKTIEYKYKGNDELVPRTTGKEIAQTTSFLLKINYFCF